MTIYYDSKTGNVERFVGKLSLQTDWKYVKLSENIEIEETGHLITFTTQIGKVPASTLSFMKKFHNYIQTVSSSGNMNWGSNFALAADIISKDYNVPMLIKFELSGLDKDVKDFIQKVTEYANKEMDTPQQ